jgi:predicted nuclease of predicted toxin-antitoxin system
MKVLVDANLSPRVAERLKQAGHDAVHVSEMDLTTADDETILSRAFEAGQVVVTADADFGALLALTGRSGPSVVLLLSADHLVPAEQPDLVLLTLERANDDLEQGAIASVAPGRVRLRSLPVGEG